jgi:hypothetical protein
MAVFTVNYSIEDEKGAKSTFAVYLPDSTLWADVLGFAASMAPLLEAMITGAIRGISVTVSVDLPSGLRVAPLATSDVEEGGRFIWASAGGFNTSGRIATFDEAAVVTGTRLIDTTGDADVAAFVSAMTTGLTVNTNLVQPVDYRGADIEALISARESFQRSRATRT